MVKILFVCLGNICRSPMAEFVMKDLVKRSGLENNFEIACAGTSDEETGNPVHRGTRDKLSKLGIDCSGKTAVQLKKSDYYNYDFIIGMEQSNVRDILRIFGKDPKKKVMRLLDLSEKPRDISDPWYTGNFESTYKDIREGCDDLLMYIVNEGLLYW